MPHKGIVKNVTFHNPDNGYSVLKLKDPETEKSFTVVGSFPKLAQGELLEIEGDWTSHSTYGSQLKAKSYKILPPNNTESMESYLASGLFKGVGPAQAKMLVDHFGSQTFEVLDNDPHRLNEIAALTSKKRDNLLVRWQEKKALKEVMYFLQSHGLTLNLANKIFKEYGSATIHKLKENPYRLAEDMWGIGFLKADEIGFKMGFDRESYERIKAGLIHTLNKSVEEGHVFLMKDQLTYQAAELLGCETELLIYTLDNLIDNTSMHKDSGDRYYKAYLFHSERGICRKLMELIFAEREIPPLTLIEKGIAQAESYFSKLFSTTFTYNFKQKQGIQNAVESGVFLLTGGPGTGKTTTLMGILKIFELTNAKIKLTAPTGRAAKRLQEVTGFGATTIHRLLQYEPETGGFLHNETKPLVADFIIVDEVSMIDTTLMYSLLRAINPHTGIILVGDENQLPSIGPGKVLSELIDSKMITHLHLNEIIRQESDSQIVRNAHLINLGQMPHLDVPDSNFIFHSCRGTEDTLALVIDLMCHKLPTQFGYHTVHDIQLITPMNKGPLGTESLNHYIQSELTPNLSGLKHKNRTFKKGDKVMQLKNNYEKNVFNGDIGFITHIDIQSKCLRVMFDDSVEYAYEDLDELNLAYAITIHKSQGSEYKVVLVLLSNQHNMMLQRNLFYTAITRAREKVFLLANSISISKAIHNNPVVNRNTRLAISLQEKLKPQDLPF